MRFFALLTLLLCSLPAFARAQDAEGEPVTLVAPETTPAAAQIFGWVDARGAWHFVDSLTLVPPEYRRQANANAMQVSVLATPSSAPAAPAISTREVGRTASKEAPKARSKQDGDRRARIEELQRDRTRLQGEIAALEEGSAPASYLDRAKGGAIDDAQIAEWLLDTEDKLDAVEGEIEQLGATPER